MPISDRLRQNLYKTILRISQNPSNEASKFSKGKLEADFVDQLTEAINSIADSSSFTSIPSFTAPNLAGLENKLGQVIQSADTSYLYIQVAEPQSNTSSWLVVTPDEGKVTKKTPVGTYINEDFSGDLSNWDVTAYTGAGGTAVINGGVLELRNSFTSPYPTNAYITYTGAGKAASENLLIEFDARVVLVDSTSRGFGAGFVTNLRDYAQIILANTGSTIGRQRLYLDEVLPAAPLQSGNSEGYMDISTGDVIKCKMHLQRDRVVLFAKNTNSTNEQQENIFVYPLDYGNGQNMHNSGYPGIFVQGGDLDILNFKVTDLSPLNPDYLFLGDSITRGIGATPLQNRWADIAMSGSDLIYSVYGGPGDLTSNVVERLSEVIRAQPTNVVLLIGQNDIQNAVANATIQTNISTIVSTLEAQDINVILCLNLPTGDADTVTINDWIVDTYGGTNTLIDLYTGFRAGAAITASAILLSGGHPTNYGHESIARYVKERLGITADVSYPDSSASVTLNSAYENSTDPEITLTSTKGAVTLEHGTLADSADSFQIKNQASAAVVRMDGEGKVEAVRYTLSGNSKIIGTGTYTLLAEDNGRKLYFTTSCTVTLPNGLANDFEATLINDGASQTLTLSAATTLNGVSSTIVGYAAIVVTHKSANVWYGL